MQNKIDFFIVGAQKSGTTALDSYLRRHHQIQMGRRKELHVFDDETVDWSRPDYEVLQAAYDWTGSHRKRGEATPIYMYWPNAMERLKAHNPEAKLIVLLRHPVMRAYSHWKMEATRGADVFPFKLAISDVGRLRLKTEPGGVHRVYSYVERGFYAQQLERMLGLFPRRNVLCLTTEDLWDLPVRTLGRIADFLGVDRAGFGGLLPEYVVPVLTRDDAGISRDDREMLMSLYGEDMRETARLTGLDLAHWQDPAYAEPITTERYPVRVGMAA